MCVLHSIMTAQVSGRLGPPMTGDHSIASNGTVNLLQGQHAISNQPGEVMTTVLGSCVAACLYDREQGIGGMNHFLLPFAEPERTDIRFAAAAMEILVNGLMRRGADRSRLTAKLFGGAHMSASFPDIGNLNAKAARKFLKDEGIPLVTSHLGGSNARRIHFWPANGRVRLRLLGPVIPTLAEAPTSPSVGEVTLFCEGRGPS